ncbi:GNAT family N-acetyltransferase [Massilia sp. TSP1-1-2]|uniref:GNAT family N-acetyltransferase n=1 Tax=unclassified Massilia TaxID=2609279 RepID=UPI003CF5A4B0
MTTDIHIRRCTSADAAALALVGQCTFLDTYADVLPGSAIIAHCSKAHSLELYKEWLANPAFQHWLAEVPGGAPVGFMVVAPPDLPLPGVSNRDAEIKRVYVLSKFQGGGVGKRFIEEAVRHAAEREANRLLLGVYAHNLAAIGFYERSGFSKVGTRTFHVGGKDFDDFIMGRQL